MAQQIPAPNFPQRLRRLHLFSPLLIVLLIGIFVIFPIAVLGVGVSHAQAYQTSSNTIAIYYAGPQDSLYVALKIAGTFTLVDNPENARVFVLNGEIPDPSDIAKYVSAGAGVVLFLAPDLTSDQVSLILGIPLELEFQEQPLSLVNAPGVSDPLLTEIVWNSAPQLRQRYQVASPVSSLVPLVTSFEDGTSILWKYQISGTSTAISNTAFVFNAFLGENNLQIQEWAYFNYLIYHLVIRAAGQEPDSFANYHASPVPHQREQIILFILLGGMLSIAVTAFILIRRYSKAHPEVLDGIVVDRQEFEKRQSQTDWNEIGFHRPLGGFMLALMLGLVLFIPVIIYQNLILPVYILPSAQALGIWGRVTQFFNFIWLFLDMGTSAAFIKFFSEYRVHDPRKAIQYGQIFVWWQALSGAIQVALVVGLAGTYLPRTVYAIYTWSVIIHTIIQVPGFYQVFRHGLMAWQRFDYAQIIEVGLSLVFPIVTQPIIVTLMVIWGRNHSVFGSSMGGLLGLGIAAYVAEALSFVLGFWLYRRLGYNSRLLFLAHFNWETIKSAFRFGVFEMLGSVAWAVGQAVEILITQTRLVNYTEIWGNWVLAQNFIYAFNVMQTLYNGLMPAISESYSNARRTLSQYYAANAYKWGGMISAFIGAVLLAVADRFILGASGPEFVRAARYAIPLIIWGAVQYPSWVGDTVQLGCNRPYLKTALVAGEQAVRIVLAFVLIERFQINALIIAYFVGLFSKGIIAYIINNRICFPQRFYIWQSFVAPILAGGAHFLLLRWVTGLIWKGDQITSVIIFLVGILISYPFYAFFYGLFGGWDDDTLAELGHGAELSSFMRPMGRLFWKASALGAHLSPLHNRFPIDIRRLAIQEANDLTAESVRV
jgi:O-antigen/teichoic acid export membrane protein